MKWEEIEHALKRKDASLLVFEASKVIERVDKIGDLFEPVLKLKQKLPQLPGMEKGAAPEAIEARMELAAQAEEARPAGLKKTRKGGAKLAPTRPAARRKRGKI